MIFKKTHFLCILVAAIFVVFAIYLIPAKTTLHKTLPCTEYETGEIINVTISGTYYTYLLSDDLFDGTIKIEGKRTCTQRFELTDDLYTNFNDAYGQPQGHILQVEKFSYISIADDDYSISSKWDSSWKKSLKQKRIMKRF